ncbi:Uncharacterized protein YraI [Madurella mycetomatis]|uniref:Uncharacterized protein YraI n=1 Tax=Madurella mycetomatis TaxID=100816 RepID=A0A175W3E8_9PEZI|nr:Uncharacterized protein YraI [Madurella mycetomatis]KXX81106.1 Uncharacterized protein YraI [Madurella mycetomatis]
MKFTTLLAAALLPAGLMAAPVVEEMSDITPRTDAASDSSELFQRGSQVCEIVGDAIRVNCRAGPGTKYRVEATLNKGTRWEFHCVRSGQCVTIDGFRNW